MKLYHERTIKGKTVYITEKHNHSIQAWNIESKKYNGNLLMISIDTHADDKLPFNMDLELFRNKSIDAKYKFKDNNAQDRELITLNSDLKTMKIINEKYLSEYSLDEVIEILSHDEQHGFALTYGLFKQIFVIHNNAKSGDLQLNNYIAYERECTTCNKRYHDNNCEINLSDTCIESNDLDIYLSKIEKKFQSLFLIQNIY